MAMNGLSQIGAAMLGGGGFGGGGGGFGGNNFGGNGNFGNGNGNFGNGTGRKGDCRGWMEKGNCSFGDRCRFEHDQSKKGKPANEGGAGGGGGGGDEDIVVSGRNRKKSEGGGRKLDKRTVDPMNLKENAKAWRVTLLTHKKQAVMLQKLNEDEEFEYIAITCPVVLKELFEKIIAKLTPGKSKCKGVTIKEKKAEKAVQGLLLSLENDEFASGDDSDKENDSGDDDKAKNKQNSEIAGALSLIAKGMEENRNSTKEILDKVLAEKKKERKMTVPTAVTPSGGKVRSPSGKMRKRASGGSKAASSKASGSSAAASKLASRLFESDTEEEEGEDEDDEEEQGAEGLNGKNAKT